MKVGILRNLLYWPLYPFWRAFFSRLGADVVVSRELQLEQFRRLRRKLVGDICLPIEAAFCHAELIKNDVDFLFLPRMNRPHRDLYVCPAAAGLPYLIQRLVPRIGNTLCLHLSPHMSLDRADVRALCPLVSDRKQILSAYSEAQATHARFVSFAADCDDLNGAIEAFEEDRHSPPPRCGDGPTVLLLGMPYVLADRFMNHGVPEMIRGLGCRVIIPSMVAPDALRRGVAINGAPAPWSMAGASIKAMTQACQHRQADGVVYCSSFACGVDSMVAPIIEAACHRQFDLPFCLLVLDEHTESLHVQVRLEAFVDCITRRKAVPSGGCR